MRCNSQLLGLVVSGNSLKARLSGLIDKMVSHTHAVFNKLRWNRGYLVSLRRFKVFQLVLSEESL